MCAISLFQISFSAFCGVSKISILISIFYFRKHFSLHHLAIWKRKTQCVSYFIYRAFKFWDCLENHKLMSWIHPEGRLFVIARSIFSLSNMRKKKATSKLWMLNMPTLLHIHFPHWNKYRQQRKNIIKYMGGKRTAKCIMY